MTADPRSDEPDSGRRSGVSGFLRDYWLWWLLPLIVAVLVAAAMLWLYEGDATSPFLYPER